MGLLYKGLDLYGMDRYKEALACFDEILQMDPDYAEVLVYKALALERLGRHEESRECLRISMIAEQGYWGTFLQVADSLMDEHKYGEAKIRYDEAIDANPDDVEALRGMGTVLVKTGSDEEALEYFSRILKIDPHDFKALAEMGAIHTDHGRYKEALACARKALRRAGCCEKALIVECTALWKTGRPKKALSRLNVTLMKYPSSEDALRMEKMIKEGQ